MEMGAGGAGGRALGFPAIDPWLAGAVAVAALLAVLVLVLLLRPRGDLESVRRAILEMDRDLRAELARSTQSGLRAAFESVLEGNRAMQATLGAFRVQVSDSLDHAAAATTHTLDAFGREQRAEQERLRALLGEQLDAMRAAVEQRLQSAVEAKMAESFSRVTEQLAQLHQDIGQVRGVAAQVGDLRRLFGNVKVRGGWGEAQVEAMLQDALPPGSYARNMRLREGSAEAVEFALRVPVAGEDVWLPIDSKFPTEDYDRLLLAAEAGRSEDEAAARRGLERRIRAEAARIGGKYVVPPRTVPFAVMYLPTDGLFAEVARVPGLIEQVRRESRVMVMGPSLLPAFLHTVRVGHLTIALERRAGEIGTLLAAVKTEWEKLGGALDTLAQRAQLLSRGIDETRTRSRAVGRKLVGVEALPEPQAQALLADDADVSA